MDNLSFSPARSYSALNASNVDLAQDITTRLIPLIKIWAPIIKRAGIRYRNAYQSRHTYACWSLSAGANPNFIATQMGHTDAQMVYKVYGKWMSEKSAEQVSLLNQALSRYAPSLPQSMVAAQ